MLHITAIRELDDTWEYLTSHGLLKQYKKAKEKILSGDMKSVLFKKRKPKTLPVYQFRINEKYRAFWLFGTKEPAVFKVFEISDHQD